MITRDIKKPAPRSEPSADAPEPDALGRIAAERRKSFISLVEHRRKSQRSSLKMLGEIAYDKHSISVYVIDGAVGGLRLQLHDAVELPQKFRLTVPSLQFQNEVFLAWQDGTLAGVEF